MGVEPGHPETLAHSLIAQAVTDLMRRGVRALEAFGRTAEADELVDHRTRTAGRPVGGRNRSVTARSTSA